MFPFDDVIMLKNYIGDLNTIDKTYSLEYRSRKEGFNTFTKRPYY